MSNKVCAYEDEGDHGLQLVRGTLVRGTDP